MEGREVGMSCDEMRQSKKGCEVWVYGKRICDIITPNGTSKLLVNSVETRVKPLV